MWRGDGHGRLGRGVRLQLFRESCATPNMIESFVASGLNEPSAWKLRDALRSPLVHRGRERILRRLFGQIEIAEQADQDSYNAAPFRPVDGLNRGVNIHRAWDDDKKLHPAVDSGIRGSIQ